ncbi:MAG: DUF4157 domain-containing protein [Deltaproteobacteria bacterium]|nr:DUF4157 domain-containing protein [Deltaproteobacteria bacterium]
MKTHQSRQGDSASSGRSESLSPGKRALTDGLVQRRRDGDGGVQPGAEQALDKASSEGGSALPTELRSRAEGSLGIDLGAARMHTGPAAAEAADSISAQAFAVGPDVFFGAERYQPGTAAGDHLIAHELVHVAQQGGAPAGPQRSAEGGVSVTSGHEAAEVEAEAGAAAILGGTPFQVSAAPSAIPRVENMSGNPQDIAANPAANEAGTVTRAPTAADTAGHVAPGPAAVEARPANVRVVASAAAPLHVDPPVCPDTSRVYEEGAEVSPPPAGMTPVTGFNGTMAAPQVQENLLPGLFMNGAPSANDVQQQGIGDCFFLAAVMTVVGSDPGKIPAMMTANPAGGATVRFWRRQAHSASFTEWLTGSGPQYDYIQVAVSVSDQIAFRNVPNGTIRGAALHAQLKAQDYWANVAGNSLEVHRRDHYEAARWVGLLEKAYARFTEQHGQYGGTHSEDSPKTGASGYANINGGWGGDALVLFYGQAADTGGSANVHREDIATYNPTANPLTANPNVVDQLLLLANRPANDPTSPVLIASALTTRLIPSLKAAIPAAIADPDWANIGADRQAKILAVQTAITAWETAGPDTAANVGPKTNAQRALGNACVEAARTPNTEHIQQTRAAIPNPPVQFEVDSDAVKPGDAPRLSHLGDWLNYVSAVGTLVPYNVNIVGHASSDGTEEHNQELSARRATNASAEISRGKNATNMARHTLTPSGVGETGAARTAAWRRVDITIEPKQGPNELLTTARSHPIRAMMDLVLDLRNAGTDASTGQRNIYGGHSYAVLGVSFVDSASHPVQVAGLTGAARTAALGTVSMTQSMVRLRNPHHGNEPDREGMNTATRPEDGTPSGRSADGIFSMDLDEFFRNFNTMESGVLPRT